MPNWIDLEGLANLRDLGGIPTIDGAKIKSGRLLRSDNLQSLTDGDVAELLDRGLTDVVDLRSDFEVTSEGPGPLTARDDIAIHHHSLIPEDEEADDEVADEVLPWVGLAPTVQVSNQVTSIYLSYVADRPQSVVAALREIAHAEGATLVHCAAGKDRTGTVVALALLLAGAEPEAVVADYAASTERMRAILDRLLASDTYYENLRGRPLASHITYPETMAAFLEHLDQEWGGVEELLAPHGWTTADTAALRAKLCD
ncbi:MAG: tyrosine-protein phosphatase [Propionibacteriaceae bacterium]